MAQDPFAKYRVAPAAEADPLAKYRTAAPAPSATESEDSDDGVSPGWAAAGLGAAGLAALVAHNPAAAQSLLGKGWKTALGVRNTLMLSGLAIPKSVLGNVGGAAMGSIERGSLAPLREMLSPATAKEAVQVFKRGHDAASAGPTTSAMSRFNIPGRIMGAMDEAGQNALQRAGYTPAESAREMLQGPLPHQWGAAMDNKVGDYLFPFRKTPYNQFSEGMKTFGPETAGQAAALGTSMATGAAAGTYAEDPKTIALTTAAHGRYGLPHMAAAMVARGLSTGSKTKAVEAARNVGPVSDYSFSEGLLRPVMQPEKVLSEPAAFGALDYLKSLLGMK